MKEETKEEYLARLRKQKGLLEPLEASKEESPKSVKAKLKSLFFLLLFALFLWTILQVFGMLKSN